MWRGCVMSVCSLPETLFTFRRGGVDFDFHSVPTNKFLFDIFYSLFSYKDLASSVAQIVSQTEESNVGNRPRLLYNGKRI